MWKAFYYLPSAYKNQFLSPKSLKTLQEKRLRYMVNHAYRNTSLYRSKFEAAGITPSDIATLEDITKIPLVTKEEIKAVFPDGIIAPGFSESNCKVETTSGTSGSILKILFNYEAWNRLKAIALRNYFAHGIRPWHKFCIVCSSPGEYESVSSSPFSRTVGVLEKNSEPLAEDIRRVNPYVLGGHPSTFFGVCRAIERNDITGITPRIVLIGGEVAYPGWRDYIEKILKTHTINKYGAAEMNSVAWECDHGSMHIDADSVIVEFVKEGEQVAPGERGEIVVTNLWNVAMPFIRYRLGDLAAPSDEPCCCGRGLPVIKELEGRLDDVVVLPSGGLIPCTRMCPLLHNTPGIAEFGIIQDNPSHVVIRIVPRDEFTEDVENTLHDKMQNVLGSSVTIDIKRVDHINRDKKIKFKRIQRTFEAHVP
ncbi:MAG: phenylacetate--CoA ligase family protein [Theionarchaea archaeon]|nr:phenylacetate--CoA ligase family protein [Theionarchaea archaeon]MBU7034285.1 phenylacetate--CoA ligase family protein [Theionarchaea archaeon]